MMPGREEELEGEGVKAHKQLVLCPMDPALPSLDRSHPQPPASSLGMEIRWGWGDSAEKEKSERRKGRHKKRKRRG